LSDEELAEKKKVEKNVEKPRFAIERLRVLQKPFDKFDQFDQIPGMVGKRTRAY